MLGTLNILSKKLIIIIIKIFIINNFSSACFRQ